MLPSTSTTINPYWGFWQTLGLGFVAFAIFGILQTIILIAYGISQKGLDLSASEDEIKSTIETFAYNGDLISVAEIPSAIIGVAFIVLFASLRRPLKIRQYLELHLPSKPIKTFLIWLGIMLLVFAAMEASNQLLDHETPEFMSKVYGSSSNKFMLWIAVAVAAPLFEEFLFRGFLLEGFRHSALGTIGAVLLTSASWAIIHLQYGWFEIISIFLIGLIFSYAKLKTGSLYVPIAMHMFMNLTASIFMELGASS